jgi:tetratricopeptide (TPR) repeat protein
LLIPHPSRERPILIHAKPEKHLPVNYSQRYFVLRFAIFVCFFASVAGFAQDSAANSAQSTGQQAPVAAASQAISEQVLEAEALITKSDWKSAAAKLDAWLTANPADARAFFDAGYVADAQNRLEDAAALYRCAVDADPKSFEAHLSLGLLLARQGHDDDARPELSLATTLDPGQAGPELKARAWRALAQIDRDEDPEAASEDLLQALKLTPETSDDTLLAAALADQVGKYEIAETAYRRILATDSKSAAANAGLAHLLIARKRYPEAETLLRAALKDAPDDPALTAQLATVLAAQNKAEALPLLQKLHAAHPANAAISGMLADVLAEAGDTAGSDSLYLELLKSSPKDASLLVGHGQNMIRQLKYAEAYAAFDKATGLDPSSADGWSGLAFAASQTNRPSVTLHALTMRSKYLPEAPSTYYLWATAYDALHDKKSAATYYHLFLDAAAGKFPSQEAQARQRLLLLGK